MVSTRLDEPRERGFTLPAKHLRVYLNVHKHRYECATFFVSGLEILCTSLDRPKMRFLLVQHRYSGVKCNLCKGLVGSQILAQGFTTVLVSKTSTNT